MIMGQFKFIWFERSNIIKKNLIYFNAALVVLKQISKQKNLLVYTILKFIVNLLNV